MKAIFATTQDNLLGLNDTMPWRLISDYKQISKLDMDYFREITKSSKVVMGYNTWISIGQKPLKGRKDHFIITTKRGLTHEDPRIRFIDLKSFVKKYSNDKDIICIGGGKIYLELMKYFDEIYWNEICLTTPQYKEMLNKNKNSKKVYLSRKLVHLLNNPSEHEMKKNASVMIFDDLGNTITYNRYTKKPTS